MTINPSDPSRYVAVVRVPAATRFGAEWIVSTAYGDQLRFRDSDQFNAVRLRERWEIVSVLQLQEVLRRCPCGVDFRLLWRPATPALQEEVELHRRLARAQARPWRQADAEARGWFGRVCGDQRCPLDWLRLLARLNEIAQIHHHVGTNPLRWLMEMMDGRDATVQEMLDMLSTLDPS